MSDRGRVAKRSCNACARCRRLKIKCSGTQPCDACKKRDITCGFDERGQKVLVTKGYLIDLQEQARNHQRQAVENADHDASAVFNSTQGDDEDEEGTAILNNNKDNDTTEQSSTSDPLIGEDSQGHRRSNLTNPLSSGLSTFMFSESDGRAYYLGTSSNWSFSRRLLNLAHECVHRSPVATATLLFDGAAYDLGWDGLRTSNPNLDAQAPMPSLDHAIFLINAVKFHCSQLFHLFEEEPFMKSLYHFYNDPDPERAMNSLFYVHLLTILAFGKALVEKSWQPSRRPPGSGFFVKALRLLPDVHVLNREPYLSVEILCCLSLYLQSLDFRESAHTYIGMAMRIALANGMHTDMPMEHLGEAVVERCRKIWWSVYVMDREMTSLMGLPQSISDDDMHTPLPTFAGSAQRSAALGMQIRLSQTIATINRKVYGANGQINKMFLKSTKQVLASIAGLADELRQTFPMHLDKTSMYGVSRVSGYLHLLYHRCIVLATRPLLFCFTKIRLESPDSYLEATGSSKTIWNLVGMCIESSQQMTNILACLQKQGLLETFLPFDLESLFISSLSLLLGPILDPGLLEHPGYWLDKAYWIFGEAATSGNIIAEYRIAELRQLGDMLGDLPPLYPPGRQPQTATTTTTTKQPDSTEPEDNNNNIQQLSPQQTMHHRPTTSQSLQDPAAAATMCPPPPTTTTTAMGAGGGGIDAATQQQQLGESCLPSPLSGVMEEFNGNMDAVFTTAQVMDMANSIANDDTEWMQHAIMDHSIW